MFDLSIIVPSIRPEEWDRLTQEINESLTCGKVTLAHEIIFVGPYPPAVKLGTNCLYIESFRSPAACLQQGADIASGTKICWLPDDIKIMPEVLAVCVYQFLQYDKTDGLILLYSEGENFTGQQHVWNDYWAARTHEGLRFKHVNHGFMIAPVFMYDTAYFKELGGLDCRFEHINLNTADLAFRLQMAGGSMYRSCARVFAANWDPNPNRVVQKAYEENDLPLFKQIWDADVLDRPVKIDFDNWQATDEKWARRFK